MLFDDNGEVVSNLGSVLREIVEAMRRDKLEEKQVTHAFNPAVFLQTDSPLFPRIKATAFFDEGGDQTKTRIPTR